MVKKKTKKRKTVRKAPTKAATKKVTKKSVKKKATRKKSSKTTSGLALPIIALIVNLIVPGLGTITGGKFKTGIWQLVFFAIGGILYSTVIGIPLMFAMFIWALISSIQMIRDATGSL